MPDYIILDQEQITLGLGPLRHWKVLNGKLHGEFKFKDFKQAFAFMTTVAIAADTADHHPEWSNLYNKVSIDYVTHDAGDKITDLDFRLADAISELADRLGAE